MKVNLSILFIVLLILRITSLTKLLYVKPHLSLLAAGMVRCGSHRASVSEGKLKRAEMYLTQGLCYDSNDNVVLALVIRNEWKCQMQRSPSNLVGSDCLIECSCKTLKRPT